MAMHVLRVATLAVVLTAGSALAKAPGQGAPLFSTPVEACIIPAARFHSVNEYILRSILKVESGLNPATTVSRNTNGTVDVGICQMNSMHFKRLAKHNIAPGHLLDPCICTYVAAWHLAEVMRNSGNTWEGIARYHSGTPYYNQRYQILLTNELIRSGVIQGKVQPVPPLYRSAPARPIGAPTAPAPVTGKSIAFDGAGSR
jgi:hypothetical protein